MWEWVIYTRGLHGGATDVVGVPDGRTNVVSKSSEVMCPVPTFVF